MVSGTPQDTSHSLDAAHGTESAGGDTDHTRRVVHSWYPSDGARRVKEDH